MMFFDAYSRALKLKIAFRIETKEIVDINDIEKSLKRRKQTYDERMDSIKAGREGRDKYGSRKGKKDKLVSSTNKEKSKKKNFIMAVHKRSVREKSKMSMRDRQVSDPMTHLLKPSLLN